MTTEQPKALMLADALEATHPAVWPYGQEAAAELRRLHELYEQARDKAVRMTEANDTWFEKTLWVQETAKPEELGMHRADVLAQRIDRLANTLAEAHATYQAKLMADEALLQQALAALQYASSQLPLPHAREIEPTIKRLEERLK
jgi:flagellar hook-basal body complex protein FliE